MMKAKIKFNNIEEVKNYIVKAMHINGDITIKHGKYVINGKSLMGIFSLDLSKPIDLNIHAEDSADEVLNILKPYMV